MRLTSFGGLATCLCAIGEINCGMGAIRSDSLFRLFAMRFGVLNDVLDGF